MASLYLPDFILNEAAKNRIEEITETLIPFKKQQGYKEFKMESDSKILESRNSRF